jgi:nucleoid-associated protein EbfC
MNPMDLMKNFQNIQSKAVEVQERLKTIRATGSAGGDMVKIEITGDFSVVSVTISPEAVDPADIVMLQDLIRAAHADAVAKVRDRIQDEMSSLTGGLDIPPGFLGS